MTPRQIATDLRNAYEGHDREAFEAALLRLVAMAEHRPLIEEIARRDPPELEPSD